MVPYDLVSLIIDLVQRITKKSKQMQIEIDVSLFINIFQQIFKILQIQNSFDLWIDTMKQYQNTVMFNNSLITNVNWEQTIKHALLTYKNSVTANKLEIYRSDINSKQEGRVAFYDAKMNKHIQSMFNALVFDISLDSFIQGLQLRP